MIRTCAWCSSRAGTVRTADFGQRQPRTRSQSAYLRQHEGGFRPSVRKSCACRQYEASARAGRRAVPKRSRSRASTPACLIATIATSPTRPCEATGRNEEGDPAAAVGRARAMDCRIALHGAAALRGIVASGRLRFADPQARSRQQGRRARARTHCASGRPRTTAGDAERCRPEGHDGEPVQVFHLDPNIQRRCGPGLK